MPGASLALFADLGGMSRPKVKCYDLRSTRALQVEGDTPLGLIQRICFIFLSTPSGWRATAFFFYHPGRGFLFLSTPSGWRATAEGSENEQIEYLFLSTPSGWRATTPLGLSIATLYISIHALRVEGDCLRDAFCRPSLQFLSTPSGWRATRVCNHRLRGGKGISIHALRVEGDVPDLYIMQRGGWISIHALRVEGDPITPITISLFSNFYPRPPGGGRRCVSLPLS